MPRLTVDANDSLPDILGQIRAAAGQTVVLEIPDQSPIFLTATEFRTLREVANTSGVQLQLETDDPLRIQLASMFELMDAPTRQAPASERVPLPSSPSFRNWRKAQTTREPREPGPAAETAEADDPIAVSRKRRRQLYGADRDEDARAEPEAAIPVGEGALDYLDKDDGGGLSAKAAGRIVAVLAVLLLVLGISGWYYMPAVTVSATLRRAPVETGLLYSVAAPGATVPTDADFSVEAQESSDGVTFAYEVPSTGVDREPRETATGTVTLRNASTKAVPVPAGTSLAPRVGMAFTTDADVEVPAGSKDGSTVGEVQVAVTASKPGGAGNLPAGALSGQVGELPLYFSNREAATAGGTDIEVRIVAQADIDTINGAMESDIRRIVAEGWGKQLGAGVSVVVPSVEVDNVGFTIDQEVGEQADAVTLSGTADATGLTYDLASVESQARESFTTALREQVPDGYELVASSVALGEPELLSESPESVEYQVSATGMAQAVFTEDMRDRLARQMSGESWSGAIEDLNGVAAFESWSMDHSPGWWPRRLPQTTSRIDITVESGPAPGDAGATPGANGAAGDGSGQ